MAQIKHKGEKSMWETLRKEEVLRKLGVDQKHGLGEEEAKKRQDKYGKNKLKDKPKESIFVRFIKQFNDFMIIILILASVISAVVSNMQGENDYIDSIIIIAIVVLNAIMGVVQEAKAEKSIEALQEMTPPKAKVIRDRTTKEINAEELVPGDMIILEAGNYVPADSRIIESFNLKIEEASLTGETEPVLKEADKICKPNVALRRHEQYGVYGKYCSKWAWKSNCNRNRDGYKSRKNSQYDDRKRSTRNTNSKETRTSGENLRNCMFGYLHYYIYHWTS